MQGRPSTGAALFFYARALDDMNKTGHDYLGIILPRYCLLGIDTTPLRSYNRSIKNKAAGQEVKDMNMTKKAAREEIERSKNNTGYFDGSVTAARMKDMLRNEMHFGEAETNVIIAALVLAGAKFVI